MILVAFFLRFTASQSCAARHSALLASTGSQYVDFGFYYGATCGAMDTHSIFVRARLARADRRALRLGVRSGGPFVTPVGDSQMTGSDSERIRVYHAHPNTKKVCTILLVACVWRCVGGGAWETPRLKHCLLAGLIKLRLRWRWCVGTWLSVVQLSETRPSLWNRLLGRDKSTIFGIDAQSTHVEFRWLSDNHLEVTCKGCESTQIEVRSLMGWSCHFLPLGVTRGKQGRPR